MELDEQTCYRALAARDRRFEGRFVVAVRTTGVYCRPGCPAPLPRPTNAHFYACPAAAEEAGFRPCRRCRPETAPGTPAWAGTSSTVNRALRLIAEGQLDGQGVEALADRLGVGARHLRRLFAEHLGVSPNAVARTRRAHFARRLIDETQLPMSDVALGSGFSSVRSFNATVRQTFRQTPRDIRRARGWPGDEVAGAGLRLRLPYRPPLDWSGLLRFLQARAVPGVEAVGSGHYRRTIGLRGQSGCLEVRHRDRGLLELRLHLPGATDLLEIVERVSRLFDLAADSRHITAHLRRDPALAGLVRQGLRVPGCWDPFELAVRAILGQQVTLRGATTLAGRLVRTFGRPLEVRHGVGLTHLFPEPHAVAGGDLCQIGLPRSRAEALRSLAQAVADGTLSLGTSAGLEEAVEHLKQLPGVGAWTAHYIAMQALGEPDALPAGDLGLRRALATNGRLLTQAQLETHAEA